ncbi:MAG: hypothetical protein M1831_001964 [Alyxoria varia]|nr:MAG: hypothetical protein M1831_001964 [Alyxoria varia]
MPVSFEVDRKYRHLLIDPDIPETEQDPLIGLNQTWLEPVRFRPIFQNIEIKAPHGKEEESKTQSIIWASAQLRKLEELLKAVPDHAKKATEHELIPPIPIISVTNHTWRFYALEGNAHVAEMAQPGSAPPPAAFLWGPLEIGSTVNVIGIVIILRALDLLMDWGVTVYRPWFVENILKPLSKDANTEW